MAHTGGRDTILAAERVAVFLKNVGSHDTILDIAQTFNMTEYSVIKARRQVSHVILRNLMPDVIKWSENLEVVAHDFKVMSFDNFPNIVGAIDGSHIPILTPLDSVL